MDLLLVLLLVAAVSLCDLRCLEHLLLMCQSEVRSEGSPSCSVVHPPSQIALDWLSGVPYFLALRRSFDNSAVSKLYGLRHDTNAMIRRFCCYAFPAINASTVPATAAGTVTNAIKLEKTKLSQNGYGSSYMIPSMSYVHMIISYDLDKYKLNDWEPPTSARLLRYYSWLKSSHMYD